MPACYFKVSEHGWTIHFDSERQPITAFSKQALLTEIRELTHGGTKVLTEFEFHEAKRHGRIEELPTPDDPTEPEGGDIA